MYDHGEPAKCSLPAIVVFSLGRLIQIEDKQQDLRVYHGEYVHDKSPGAPSKVIAEDLVAVHDGASDDVNRAVADLDSTLRGVVAGCAREIRESLRLIQQDPREVGMEVPRNLLELLSSLAEMPIAVLSSAITWSLERMAQQDALCENVGRFQNPLLARESN